MTAKKIIHCFVGMLWYGFAGVAVLAAVVLTIARLLLPLAENYLAEAEQTLSEYAGQPIKVESLKAQWAGFEPQLHFSNVRLYDKNNETILFQFKDARMGINLFSSVSNRDFVPSSFTVSGISLAMTRHADQHISVDGLSDTKNKSQNDYSELLFEWLLRQPDIGIESSNITWTDVPLNEKDILFTNVNLRLRNYADVHQLDGNVNLPERLGKTISIAAELQGDSSDLTAWQGDVYVKSEGLVIPAWWRKPLYEGVNLTAGYTNFELWGKWKDHSLKDLEGTLSLSDLIFKGENAQAIKFNGLTTALSWHQSDNDVSLYLDGFSPKTTQGEWPRSQFNFISDNVTERLAIVAGYVKLSDILPAIDIFKIVDIASLERLKSINPSVDLQNLSFVKSTADAVQQWHVDGQFSDLITQHWNDVPGISGLSGRFSIDNGNGNLQLNSTNTLLDVKDVFRKPIELTSLQGNVQWQLNESGVSIQANDVDVSNADIAARARMSLRLPKDGSPVIDLLADIERAKGSATHKYLPLPVLSDKTIAWLDKSIIKGKISNGKFVLRGALDKFPFDHGEGKFETRFDVTDGQLDYEPGWPAISKIQGEVIFSGRSLDIVGRSGQILKANVHDVTAHVADLELDDPLLELRGEVDSSTQDLVQYIVASNLVDGYSKELQQLESQGSAALKLEIDIPMTSGDGKVKGETELKNVNLNLKGNNIKLKEINGKVSVSNEGLQAKNVKGRLFKTPVDIQLSHDDDVETVLSIKAKGQFDLNELIKDEFIKDAPIISEGKTEWLANLVFQEPNNDKPSVKFELDSELKGASINLPVPFNKEKNALRSFKLVSFFKDENTIQLDIDFGDDVNSTIHLKNNDEFEYIGSSLAFGDELPIEPINNRLAITGQLDTLSLDDWMVYTQKAPWLNDSQQVSSSLNWLESVDIEVATLVVMDSSFNLKRLKLERKDEAWQTTISADRVKGDIRIPYNFTDGTIKASLELLKIERVGDETTTLDFDPREFPNLALSVDQLFFDGVNLGTLNMTASKTDTGIAMNKLVIDSRDTSLKASGSWSITDDEQITHFIAKLKTKRFSELLTELGYSTGFEAGKSGNSVDLKWSGNPLQFAIPKLNGSMQIRISKGQLLDVSPGAGRVFGLLSLQALPRRLTLDFSDLFKKGFSFDRIKGNFLVTQGDAYTTDLYLDGPAARIDVSGRTGLVARDYDQLITVTPDLTGSLPIAGALLGGPIAGGVVFALDKILRPTIDDITRYQYTVTGGWDDPNVEQLQNIALDKAKK